MSNYEHFNSEEEVPKMSSVLINNQNNELFDDDDYVAHKLINVRRVALPNSGEDWEILEDGIVVLTLKGVRLTKKEKSVLYTPEGLNIVISEYKCGNKSVKGIKNKLRERWQDNHDKV